MWILQVRVPVNAGVNYPYLLEVMPYEGQSSCIIVFILNWVLISFPVRTPTYDNQMCLEPPENVTGFSLFHNV